MLGKVRDPEFVGLLVEGAGQHHQLHRYAPGHPLMRKQRVSKSIIQPPPDDPRVGLQFADFVRPFAGSRSVAIGRARAKCPRNYRQNKEQPEPHAPGRDGKRRYH